MPLTCQAIIFDLDGVLVDSHPLTMRHWRRWADEHDVDFDDITQEHHGRPTVEIIREVAPHLDAEAEAEKKEGREATDTDGLTMFDGADTLIGGLPDARWTIATSGRRQTATLRLDHVGLPEPPTLVTADDITNGKPAPDPYLLAAERLGIDPSDCLVIEDAPAGVASAQAAGAQVIAVTTTSSPEAMADADAVVGAVGDVTATLNDDGRLHVEWNDDLKPAASAT